jgi:hypothetical protein
MEALPPDAFEGEVFGSCHGLAPGLEKADQPARIPAVARLVLPCAYAISTFSGTCQKYLLGLYSAPDLDAFFSRLAESGPTVDVALRGQVLTHAGAHPLLLDALAFWLVEMCGGSGRWDIEAAAEAAREDCLGAFDHIAALLREDHRLSQLLQILLSPNP